MRKTALTVAVLYIAFAGLSTVLNIGAQMISMALYAGPRAVELSILMGTVVGLPLRYILEKRFIFAFKSRGMAHDGRLFVLYGFMGVFTTAVFWGVEYAFHLLFRTDAMRYAGGIIGLAIGYFLKYQLDKKYVFVSGGLRTAP